MPAAAWARGCVGLRVRVRVRVSPLLRLLGAETRMGEHEAGQHEEPRHLVRVRGRARGRGRARARVRVRVRVRVNGTHVKPHPRNWSPG